MYNCKGLAGTSKSVNRSPKVVFYKMPQNKLKLKHFVLNTCFKKAFPYKINNYRFVCHTYRRTSKQNTLTDRCTGCCVYGQGPQLEARRMRLTDWKITNCSPNSPQTALLIEAIRLFVAIVLTTECNPL